jgi:phospholipase C
MKSRVKEHRMKRLFLLIPLIFLPLVGDGLAHSPAQATHRSLSNPIKHIVFIEKENHTFDSMFGGYQCLDAQGKRSVACVNGASTGKIKVNGVVSTIPLNPAPDRPTNYCHEWSCAHKAADGGAMDYFNASKGCSTSPYPCYLKGTSMLAPNYWKYADNYVLDDNAYSSEEAASFANHLFMVAAASGADLADSDIINPKDATGRTPHQWGCNAPSGTTITLYNRSKVYPCFDNGSGHGKSFSTLADEMNAAGVSWKFYTVLNQSDTGYQWNTLNAFPGLRSVSNVVSWEKFATDAANGNLPAFSWLTAPQAQSEHAPASTCIGENWTVQQIKAVMRGPDWSSTVMIISWDDYGGLYDHVAPPTIDGLGYGFRVPFLVISPFARATDNASQPNISHDQLSFESVLKLAEETFGLPALTSRDANAGDLMNLLDSSASDPPLLLSTRTCLAQSMPLTGDWND